MADAPRIRSSACADTVISKLARLNTPTLAQHKEQVMNCLNVAGLALWIQLSQQEQQAVKIRAPILKMHHCYELAEPIEDSMEFLWNARPVHFHYMSEQLCFMCGLQHISEIHSDYGVYAHPKCITANVVDIGRLGHLLPLDHLSSTLPHGGAEKNIKVFKVLAAKVGVIPEESTLQWYRKQFKELIADHQRRYELAEQDRKQQSAVKRKKAIGNKTAALRQWKLTFHELAGREDW